MKRITRKKMSSDMNERPEGFRDTLCPVDTHPCEGQGTDADCRACLTKARLEADLRGAQLLMVSSELAGDPKMDHADRSDPRWTPTLHEAWCARQKHKENERLLSSVEGYRRDIDNCLAELKHKNKVLRDREREPAPQPGARELYAAWAEGAEAAICTFASDERPPSGPEVDRFYAKNPYKNRPSTPKGSGRAEADNANLRTALEDVARDCDAVVKVHLPDLRMQAMWMRGLVRHIAGEARAAARRGIL